MRPVKRDPSDLHNGTPQPSALPNGQIQYPVVRRTGGRILSHGGDNRWHFFLSAEPRKAAGRLRHTRSLMLIHWSYICAYNAVCSMPVVTASVSLNLSYMC